MVSGSTKRLALAVPLFALASVVPSTAAASSGLDSPDLGAEQVGRGSAWVARADDPLATYFNPAALVTQPHGVHVGAHLMFMHRCFTRLGPGGTPVSPGGGLTGPGAPGGPDAEICAETQPFPNPQIAATFRLTDKLALGLAVMGPHGVGSFSWPESVEYTNQFGAKTSQPAPQRYLLVEGDVIAVWPMVSVGYAITDSISVGAGFLWGISSLQVTNFSETVSPAPAPGTGPAHDDFINNQDVKATVTGKDYFVPGFVVGGLWQATKWLDVAAWYKWQDAVRAKTDLYAQSHYWAANGQRNPDPANGPDSPANITDEKDAGTITFRIPMEAKIGARYHHPRGGAAGPRPRWAQGDKKVRDPLSEDLFDVELDVTWANNSAVDTIEVRFRGDKTLPGEPIPIAGTPGTAPVNADLPYQWNDVIGVRLGGELVALQNLLALRAGAFVETKGQDDERLSMDFDLAARVGISGGVTVRLGPVDVTAAYQHTFFGTLDNGGVGALHGMSGDATSDYRTRQTVNGGKLTTSLNEVALGGTLRF